MIWEIMSKKPYLLLLIHNQPSWPDSIVRIYHEFIIIQMSPNLCDHLGRIQT